MKTCTDRALAVLLCLCPSWATASLWSAPQPPLPPHTERADVTRRIVFNGLDMHASVFRSDLPVPQLVAFYRKAWKGQVVVNQLGQDTVIGHRQGDWFITVQAHADGDGSKGDFGAIDITSAPSTPYLGKGLPRPMGSKVFNDIAYPDDPGDARTVAMRNALSPLQNASFFRERLAGEGWKPTDESHCSADRCVLSYARGDRHLALVALRSKDGSQVVINLSSP